MTPQSHLSAILEGHIGPETLKWLQEVVRVACDSEIPLEAAMRLPGSVTRAILMERRNEAIAKGVEIAGSAGALIERFSQWRLNPGVWPQLHAVFEQLYFLEAAGYALPSERQCQRITGQTTSNVAYLPANPSRLSK